MKGSVGRREYTNRFSEDCRGETLEQRPHGHVPGIERAGAKIEGARTDDQHDIVALRRRQILPTIGESIETNLLSRHISFESMQWCSLHDLDGHVRAQDVTDNALDTRYACE